MADIALVTAGRVEVVGIPVRQGTYVAGEAIVAGAPCTLNASGAAINSDGNGAGVIATLRAGIATKSVATGEPVTCIKEGRIDGYDFTSQAYGAQIFVSDTGAGGTLGDVAGTTSMVVGTVEPAGAHPITSGRDKILNV